jgi:hypothetical protein
MVLFQVDKAFNLSWTGCQPKFVPVRAFGRRVRNFTLVII